MGTVLPDTDRRVRAWLDELAGEVAVSSTPPAASGSGAEGVTAYVLDLLPEASPRVDAHQPGPATVWMRYLVCGASPEPGDALELLDAVLGALLDPAAGGAGDLELLLDQGADLATLWQSLGVEPRPAVVVRARARFERARQEAPPVLTPLRIVGSPVRSIAGRVLGPGDVPLTGADVMLPSTGAHTRTSTSGAFTLPNVPGGPLTLSVRTKGRSFHVAVEPADGPITIRCDPTEASP